METRTTLKPLESSLLITIDERQNLLKKQNESSLADMETRITNKQKELADEIETITSIQDLKSIICRLHSTNDSLNLLTATCQLMENCFFKQQKEGFESTMKSSAIFDERVNRSLADMETRFTNKHKGDIENLTHKIIDKVHDYIENHPNWNLV